MATAKDISPRVGTEPICRALGVSRATVYRRRSQDKSTEREQKRRPTPARALPKEQRREVLDLLHSEPFVDKAPGEVFATLLDQGVYLCAERTMYRILAEQEEVRERRNQLTHRKVARPELEATGPNQVWSWDITKLKGPVKWTYFSLYVILDIFSRYVVGWMVARRESAALAKRLITESCEKQAVLPGQLIIHADRGPAMKSKGVAQLMGDLGVTKSHSRPHVSNDNPFSESQFKTLKYRPDFPDRFGSIEDCLSFCRAFFSWYNIEHHHSGIAMLTPEAVHYGRVQEIQAFRQEVLMKAYQTHPERFVNAVPRPMKLPERVWINPPLRGNATVKDIH